MALDAKYGRVTVENGDIGEDEPVVVFRAQDKLLSELLSMYKQLCLVKGSPQRHIDLIKSTHATVLLWQADHLTKTPSSDSLKMKETE